MFYVFHYEDCFVCSMNFLFRSFYGPSVLSVQKTSKTQKQEMKVLISFRKIRLITVAVKREVDNCSRNKNVK